MISIRQYIEDTNSEKIDFETTAEKDRHNICKMGRLFWGDNKQCYSGDAVYRKIKEMIKELQ